MSEILPNDPELLRKYGRRIVLVHNFIAAPDEFARLQRRWLAGVAPAHAGDLTAAGVLEGNVWHEVGHYLGPNDQVDGRAIKDVLENAGDVLEELKADLLSVFATARLREAGVFDARLDRENEAGLVSECLRSVKPSRTQAHANGRLILTNGLLDHGVIVPVGGRLAIHYGALDDAIVAMLRELLEIQSRGTREAAQAYIDRHGAWDERHESTAMAVGAAETQRLHRFRNAALD